MENNPVQDRGEQNEAFSVLNLSSAVKLTPLQLNNVRIDLKHTVLTPDYLENLIKQKEN